MRFEQARMWGRVAPHYFCSQTRRGFGETVPAHPSSALWLTDGSSLVLWAHRSGASLLALREEQDAEKNCSGGFWQPHWRHCSPAVFGPRGSHPWTLPTLSGSQLEGLQPGSDCGCWGVSLHSGGKGWKRRRPRRCRL